jgi:hypothetical protein
MVLVFHAFTPVSVKLNRSVAGIHRANDLRGVGSGRQFDIVRRLATTPRPIGSAKLSPTMPHYSYRSLATADKTRFGSA